MGHNIQVQERSEDRCGSSWSREEKISLKSWKPKSNEEQHNSQYNQCCKGPLRIVDDNDLAFFSAIFTNSNKQNILW